MTSKLAATLYVTGADDELVKRAFQCTELGFVALPLSVGP
jgi:hypothetical protein